MNKNNGFTLNELLSVVIILALTFMFALPKIASLIKEGNNIEVRLIEQKALVSAKKYINNYDTNFLNHFINVGYEKIVLSGSYTSSFKELEKNIVVQLDILLSINGVCNSQLGIELSLV